jgi:putative endonuclease
MAACTPCLPTCTCSASKPNGTLYTGVTSDLLARIHQHRNDLVEGFSKQYAVHNLVWFEAGESIVSAIGREKQIKNWKRECKIALLEMGNPHWLDLYDSLL